MKKPDIYNILFSEYCLIISKYFFRNYTESKDFKNFKILTDIQNTQKVILCKILMNLSLN